MTPSDIQRLTQSVEKLIDQREDMMKQTNNVETDLKVHIGEDTALRNQIISTIDDLSPRVKDLEDFKAGLEGQEKGRGWVQKYLPWVISMFLVAEKIIKEVIK